MTLVIVSTWQNSRISTARTDPILNARRVHHDGQQVALRVYRDVPLASLDLLARGIRAAPF